MADRTGARATREAMTFRVFVSSTFTDLVAERNALQADVWPKLQALCFRHGARFQAVDLRWGVSEEAAQAQQTMRLCLDEIARCQQVTPRPNFIVLLGQRYGWRPPPDAIPGDEFEAITALLAPHERALLDKWYARDDNAVPPEYCLLPRRDVAYEDWTGIEAGLHAALLAGARAAGLGEEAMVKYQRSATEQEIIEGALKADPRNAFSYVREIAGLPEDEGAADFLDLADGAPDREAQRLIVDLKRRLEAHFPEEQRHEIPATWTDEGLSEAHLDRLCELVHDDLERVILAQIAAAEAVDPLDHEIAQHERFAEDRKRHFVGRQEIIARIVDYVRQGGRHPLVVHGRSGSGKSALMARVLEELPGDATVMVRFIGATPASTGLHFLLQSLCEQMHREFGLDALEEQWRPPRFKKRGEQPTNPYTIPADPEQLPRAFERFLGFVPENRELVLVLDALDQLSPTGGAHALNWLPRELPGNVRVVVSVLEREDAAGECHRAAQHRLPQEALLALPELTLEVCREALDRWLAEQGAGGGRAGTVRPRRLTVEQRSHLGENLRACEEGRALYVRLAFEEARLWRSFEPLPTGADDVPGLSPTVEGIIADMLARLESPVNHGRVLTKAALGYLAAARNGLADGEMLDVLTADDEVWQWVEAGARHRLIERRLPPVIWSRLYFDLQPYLAERAADDTALLGFYHRQVGEVVQARYLGEETDRLRAHRALGDYFAAQGPWADAEGQRANLRRASELAWQQTGAEDWDGLEATLTDFSSLDAKVRGVSAQSLIEDYERAAGAGAEMGEERAASLRLIGGALRLSAHVLARDPDQLLYQLWGRLSRFENRPIEALLAGGREATRRPWLHPVTALTPPGGPLLRTLAGHSSYVNAVAVTPDGRRAVSGSGYRTLKVWDLESGEELRTLAGHESSVFAVAVTPDGRRAVSGSDDKTLKVWDLENGEELRTLAGHSRGVSAVALTPDGRRAVSGSWDNTLKVWDLETGEELRTLAGHSRGVTAVAVTPDGLRAVSGSDDKTLKVWDLESGEELRTLVGHSSDVNAVAVTPDGRRAVSGAGEFGRDNTLKVWDLETGEERHTLAGHSDRVRAVAVTPDGRRAVSGSRDRTLKVWDLGSGEELRTLRGHMDEVKAVAVTPCGRRAVSGSVDETLKVWDLESGEERRTLAGHTAPVSALAVTPDGSRAVSGSWDNTLKVWDLESGEELRTLAGHSSYVSAVAVAPDSRRAVSGSKDNTLKVWDLESGEELRTLAGHSDWVEALAVTPDGRRAVSGSWDNTLKVWDLESGEELHTLEGHSSLVLAVAVTPDGRRAVSHSLNTTLKVWDLESGEELRTLAGHSWGSVTPDGRRAVSKARDKTLWVWDLGGGDELRFLRGHSEDVTAGAVTPDGRRAISGSVDRTLKVWDMESGEELRTLAGHSDPVTAVAVTPDGRRAVSGAGAYGGTDNTLKVWDLESGACECTLVAEAPVFACAVALDGLAVVAGDRGGHVYILRLENVTPEPPACTAWHSPGEDAPAVGCLHCRAWSEVSSSALGTELPCPHCGGMLRLNPFVIEADWRPIATAWRGDTT